MGVLNIDDHLKHRRAFPDDSTVDYRDYTWEEEDPSELLDEPAEPIRSNRQRKSKLKPQYHLNTASRRPKGIRSGRRYENTCFLLSLVDHEEIHELELSDIVNKTMTIFSSLFEDPQKMKIWNDYANLPEEEQNDYFCPQTTRQEHASPDCMTAETRQCTEGELYAMAEKSYLNIDKKIRQTFQRQRFPVGGLEVLEKDLISLKDFPDFVLVSNYPSSFDRMLVHAICQYLKLLCRSHNCSGIRLMEIENNQGENTTPQILLSKYLNKKVLH